MANKAAIVQAMLGAPYDLARANCWHVATKAMRDAFGRELPRFRARDAISPESRVAALQAFRGWDGWQEIAAPEDGALALMTQHGCSPDLHVGVWFDFGPQSGLLHADSDVGCVVFDDLLQLRARGWAAVRWFKPASCLS